MKTISAILMATTLFAIPTMADSHGGVAASNAQMKAVTEYALNNGGSLDRVLKIEKKLGTDLFVISYGNMSSRTDKESISSRETVEAIVNQDETIEYSVTIKHVK